MKWQKGNKILFVNVFLYLFLKVSYQIDCLKEAWLGRTQKMSLGIADGRKNFNPYLHFLILILVLPAVLQNMSCKACNSQCFILVREYPKSI